MHEKKTVTVTGLAHDLRGVANIDGVVWFVADALPGERVVAHVLSRHPRRVDAIASEVQLASSLRVEPACEHYAQCGGCALQHLSHPGQLVLKQQAMLQQLQRIGKLVPQRVLEPLSAAPWAYRRRARLGIRRLPEGGVQVGFRQRQSNEVVSVPECRTLLPALKHLLLPLQTCLSQWSQPRLLGHVDLLCEQECVQLGLRVTAAPASVDVEMLAAFANEYGVDAFLIVGEASTVVPVAGCVNAARSMPGDFLQGHADVNAAMIQGVLEQLDLQQSDCVLEGFCGLGNFTLPIAASVASIKGLEVSADMVRRARVAAVQAGCGNVTFEVDNLDDSTQLAQAVGFTKVLLDPPRTGARYFCEKVNLEEVQRLVYVSCNPATLARDAAILVERGLDLVSVQLADMFPQTVHAEVVALFGPASNKRKRQTVPPARGPRSVKAAWRRS
jgi:23S rRNA (uracil1939-C5)-methyltransferase